MGPANFFASQSIVLSYQFDCHYLCLFVQSHDPGHRPVLSFSCIHLLCSSQILPSLRLLMLVVAGDFMVCLSVMLAGFSLELVVYWLILYHHFFTTYSQPFTPINLYWPTAITATPHSILYYATPSMHNISQPYSIAPPPHNDYNRLSNHHHYPVLTNQMMRSCWKEHFDYFTRP